MDVDHLTGGRKRHRSLRGALLISVAVAVASTTIIVAIGGWADERRQGQVYLAQVESDSNRMTLELGRATAIAAVAEHESSSGLRLIMPGLRKMIEKLDAHTHEALAQMASLRFAADDAERIHQTYDNFRDSIFMAVDLMEQGEYSEAWIYNRQRIDPDHQLVRDAVADMNAAYAAGAEKARTAAEVGILALFLFGAVCYVFLRRKIERQREAFSQKLAHQAFHDPLTDLVNRTMLEERVGQALARTQRSGSPMGLLFIDLDNFKNVNDSLGHHGGDEFLIEIARRLRECTRTADTIARLGGDEFAVLLEDMAGAYDAEDVARRILTSLNDPFESGGRSLRTSCSIGLSVSVDGSESIDELLGNADVAMYAAKAAGKDGYETFSPGMKLSQLDRVAQQTDLQDAIDGNHLVVHYQPIVDLNDDEMVGVEALVRWDHPERGLLPPGDFIPLAEETGQIVAIGRWVLAESCRQVAAWHADRPGLTLSVNLSAVQFGQHDLVDDVRMALISSGLAAESLVLEITESTLMMDGDPLKQLDELKALGVRIAIDDFGVGYSSLSYLRRFPVDHLKIDRSFVQSVAGGPEDAALCEAIVKLGQSLGLVTVAEGIEDQEQLAWFKGKDCPYGQGFLFQKPVPADLFDGLMSTRPSEWPQETLTAV